MCGKFVLDSTSRGSMTALSIQGARTARILPAWREGKLDILESACNNRNIEVRSGDQAHRGGAVIVFPSMM